MGITPSFFEFGNIIDIDLSIAHTDEPIEVFAAILAVLYCDGTGSIKLDKIGAASLNLTRIGTMNFGEHPVERLYLTNTSQAGKTAQILVTELKDVTIVAAPIAGTAILIDPNNVRYDAREADQDITEIEDNDIRNTSAHNSDPITAGAHRSFTFVFISTLDDVVNIQLQGSHDGTTWLDIGSATAVAATSEEYQTITEAWHSYRCVSTAPTGPTSGTLLIECIRRS